MNASSLTVLSKYSSIAKIVEEARKYAEENSLVPLVSFYLEDELLKNLIKKLDSQFSDIYREYGYEKSIFVKKLLSKFNEKNNQIQEFPYYLIPIGDECVVTFLDNDKVPPRAVPISGTFRLTFLPYHSPEELQNAIAKGVEDDILIEFKERRQVSFERKRNIFMDGRSVEKIRDSIFSGNFVPSINLMLITTIIANNVRPLENEVVIMRESNTYRFKIRSGKAKEEEVINGDTLLLKEKGNLYYDYKKRAIVKEEIAKSIAWKISQ